MKMSQRTKNRLAEHKDLRSTGRVIRGRDALWDTSKEDPECDWQFYECHDPNCSWLGALPVGSVQSR